MNKDLFGEEIKIWKDTVTKMIENPKEGDYYLDDQANYHAYNNKVWKIVGKPTNDSVVNSVIDQFVERSKLGFNKYGTNLDRTDLSVLEWIEHAKTESMDFILYLERLKKELSKNGK